MTLLACFYITVRYIVKEKMRGILIIIFYICTIPFLIAMIVTISLEFSQE